uniref:Uncharacterized protein n=1 Tax=Gasterosteus aculeatus aculeatus TaxID=481459 RepID=A0AAQ4QHZ1_GASAC
MSTSVMNKVSIDNIVAVCQYSLPLSLTFYFISFLLVAVYAWKSRIPIQGWRARPTKDEGVQIQCRRKIVALPLYGIVWMIPIVMYLAYVLTPLIKYTSLFPVSGSLSIVRNDTKYCTSCILFLHVWRDSCSDDERIHDTFIRVFLFLVVIPVMLSCSVIYYKVGKWYERNEQEGLFPVEGDGRSRRRIKGVGDPTSRRPLTFGGTFFVLQKQPPGLRQCDPMAAHFMYLNECRLKHMISFLSQG